MNPPSEDIKDLIEADSSLGLVFATDLFVGLLPETPDQCVAVRDVPGLSLLNNRVTEERPMVHVVVRGNRGDYRGAQVIAQNVRDVLHGSVNTTINSARYIDIRCESDVGFIGVDEQERPKFTSSYSIHRTMA